jgi:DNA polymerase-4
MIGPSLRAMGMGAGPTEVRADPWVPRSRSRETTFQRDLTDRAAVEEQVARLARELAEEAAATDRLVARVALKVRVSPYFTRTSAVTLTAPTRDPGEIERAALTVLEHFDLTRPVRLLGVRVEYERSGVGRAPVRGSNINRPRGPPRSHDGAGQP